MSDSATARLFGPRPHGSEPRIISMATARLGVRREIASGKWSGNELTCLQAMLDDRDLLQAALSRPEAASLLDPSDPTTPTPKRDWTSFFQAFGDFIVKIMPVILQIVQALGALSVPVAKAATVTAAHLEMPTDFALPPGTDTLAITIAKLVWQFIEPQLEAWLRSKTAA